jgi:hypothetical protein
MGVPAVVGGSAVAATGFTAGVIAAAPVVAVGVSSAIALGVLCNKTADVYKDLGCTKNETHSWICYPILAAALGQCGGALAAAASTGLMFLMPAHAESVRKALDMLNGK